MKYHTVKEIADMLQLTERGVQKWIREGKLAGYKLGREFRIEENDLKAFMESRKNIK
jgi:excisionase family DNA binding protein